MFSILWKKDFYVANDLISFPLYIIADGNTFPDDEWTDFGVVVLRWWLSAIQSAELNKAKCFELVFMDGPYIIECQREDQNVHMTFVCKRRCDSVLFEYKTSFSTLMAEVVRTSKEILKYTRQLGLSNKELDKLSQMLRVYSPH